MTLKDDALRLLEALCRRLLDDHIADFVRDRIKIVADRELNKILCDRICVTGTAWNI